MGYEYPESMDRRKDNWAALSQMFKFSDIVRRENLYN